MVRSLVDPDPIRICIKELYGSVFGIRIRIYTGKNRGKRCKIEEKNHYFFWCHYFLIVKKNFKENCLHLKLFFLFFLNLKHTGISESGSDSGIKLGQMQNPDKNSTYLEFRSTTLVSCTDPDRTLPYLLKY